jgi:hypothetical protein
VISADAVPQVRDHDAACSLPELAMLSVMAHPSDFMEAAWPVGSANTPNRPGPQVRGNVRDPPESGLYITGSKRAPLS